MTYLDNLLRGLCLQTPPISKPIKELLKEAASHLQGGSRRIFMAKTEKALGKGKPHGIPHGVKIVIRKNRSRKTGARLWVSFYMSSN